MSYLDNIFDDAHGSPVTYRMTDGMPELAYLRLPDMLSWAVCIREIMLGGGSDRGYRRPFVGTCREICLVITIYGVTTG